MRGLLADHNAEGHLSAILRVCRSAPWIQLWESFRLPAYQFADRGLDDRIPDNLLWEYCQREQLLLLTNNRNEDGEDSLGVTIRTANTPASLPVLTLASSDRILADYAYAERVTVRLMEIILDIEKLRGAGRIFLP